MRPAPSWCARSPSACRKAPWIELFEGTFAVELVVDARERSAGAWSVSWPATPTAASSCIGRRAWCSPPAASASSIRYTTNPPESTGDGLALAARAGARLVDLEFVQFHPTALAVGPRSAAAAHRGAARRGRRARRRRAASASCSASTPTRELAPRDVVARGIWKRIGGRARGLPRRPRGGRRALPDALPDRLRELPRGRASTRASSRCRSSPAAHYFMGGVAVDERGRTSLPGLWACGEVSATGVHGANRLASNSLLEALVFGARVAESESRQSAELPPPRCAVGPAGRPGVGGGARPIAGCAELRRELRALAWEKLGLVRDGAGLAAARAHASTSIWRALPAAPCEARNLAIAGAARRRGRARARGEPRRALPQRLPGARGAWRVPPVR